MTQTQNYKSLVAGDVYQEGDQFRRKPGPVVHKNSERDWAKMSPGMHGHKVLPADLILNEFRRPQ